jgi:hypothetical protein
LRGTLAQFTPSSVTVPPLTVIRRRRASIIEDFPAAVRPTTPTLCVCECVCLCVCLCVCVCVVCSGPPHHTDPVVLESNGYSV